MNVNTDTNIALNAHTNDINSNLFNFNTDSNLNTDFNNDLTNKDIPIQDYLLSLYINDSLPIPL